MFRVVLWSLFFILGVKDFVFAEMPLQIEIDFPHGQDSVFGVQMYEKGVIGPASINQDMEFPLPAKITVSNKTDRLISNLVMEFKIKEPLMFLVPEKSIWEIKNLLPGENESILVQIKRPETKVLEKKTTECLLTYKGKGSQDKIPFSIEGSYPLKVLHRTTPWMTWLVTFSGLIGLLLLLLFGKYRGLFLTYSTAEIVTMAIFISFHVAGSVFTQILKTLGAPSLAVHFVWVIYFWLLLVGLIRLVPKKGTVLIFVFGSAVILNLLLWGFNPIQILTYTICSALSLEVWFRLTGFGRSLFSVIGASLIYVLYPVSFFWFFVAPVLYHHFYSLWYIQLWLVFNLVSYLSSSILGYLFATRLVKVVR